MQMCICKKNIYFRLSVFHVGEPMVVIDVSTTCAIFSGNNFACVVLDGERPPERFLFLVNQPVKKKKDREGSSCALKVSVHSRSCHALSRCDSLSYRSMA